jgi:drug/metabolite transporter (DMT)-like permease
MPLWIVATLAAASFQTARFMLQKMLAVGGLSATGATFARFFYSAPLIALLLGIALAARGESLPDLPPAFWAFGAAGGLAQILATVFVVLTFRDRNFAVGITLKKTEVMQTVLVSLILLGEGVSIAAFACMLGGLWGVLLLSDPRGGTGSLWRRVANRAAAFGLASGVFFAVSGVCYRGASLTLDVEQPLMRAGVTLAAVTLMQMAGMAAWLRWREPGEIGRVAAAWRKAGLVGLSSMAGSFCWFTAFTLQNVAYVNALGQVELILSLLVSVLVFRERVSGRELAGIAVLGLSIVALILVI